MAKRTKEHCEKVARTCTIDESPMAYKPVQAILDNIGDLCTVDTVIKPEYNFKAS